MTVNKINWDIENVPEELRPFCNNIAAFVNRKITQEGFDIDVEFIKGNQVDILTVFLKCGKAIINYDKPFHAARGIGALLAGLVGEKQLYTERIPFERLGIMLDCSRNAVMTVEHLKKWFDVISLLGYNVVMLYTEDSYELDGEPYFGYLRGRYTEDELKEIDHYADEMNIEVVGCIQTLGHLEHLLKWPVYAHVKDTNKVLLVDKDETYQLIEKMIGHFAQCFSSRRIHIGMDETFDLGLGKYLRLNGYEPAHDIFNRHLNQVVEICNKYNLSPMIWSDNYFRTGDVRCENYDAEAVIPEHVKNSIPREAELVFWDYYRDNEKYYIDLIKRHRELDKEPIMASGVWTWSQFWYNHHKTTDNAVPCIKASVKEGLRELLFTMWGDNGAYCEFDSALAGMAFCAEVAYAGEKYDEQKLASRFEAICGTSYQAVIEASGINQICDLANYMWDDPLVGAEWKERKKERHDYWHDALHKSKELAGKLACYSKVTKPIDMAHAFCIVELVKERIEVSLLLENAYHARNYENLGLVQERIPMILQKIDEVLKSFRRQWYKRNKQFGLETVQLRFGGLKERYLELDRHLNDLTNGRIKSIHELDDSLTKLALAGVD